MCSRRSATPDVATAKARPVTTSASRPGYSGSAIPIRHSRSPLHWTSPPSLTLCPAGPAAMRIAAARSTAHPLTYPEGSNLPPGVVVKYPPLRALIAAHAWSTSASSGAHCSSGTAPRPNRLTSLSSRYGEGDDRTHHVLGVPAAIRAHAGSGTLVQRALQRLDVARAGVGGAGHRVDLAVLRRQRLADQLGESHGADLDVVKGVGRLDEDRDLDDLAGPLDQLDLDRAVGGAGHLPVDGGLARRQVPGYRPLRERPGDDLGLPAARGRRRRGRGTARTAGRGGYRGGRHVRLERQQGHETGDGAGDGQDHPAHARIPPQNSNDSKWMCRLGTPAARSARTAEEVMPAGPQT